MSTEELQHSLNNWQASNEAFLALIGTLPRTLREKEGACGVWTPKQVIAHLAGWQREALKRYEMFAKGETTSIRYDVDKFNADSVAALKLLSWYETIETFEHTCDDLQAFVETNPNRKQRGWLKALDRDLREHTEELRQWMTDQTEEN